MTTWSTKSAHPSASRVYLVTNGCPGQSVMVVPTHSVTALDINSEIHQGLRLRSCSRPIASSPKWRIFAAITASASTLKQKCCCRDDQKEQYSSLLTVSVHAACVLEAINDSFSPPRSKY
ncbi:hypothetical protein ILYODFUR_012820 [Ilyodon furcidens]|uniref:Uncharacterized protein n=1 Tax=Ilyodon furcidens TaxID=33524 RepID=A0ABV0V2N3_9TELE